MLSLPLIVLKLRPLVYLQREWLHRPCAGQPCYSVCEIAQEGRARACHRLDTERSRKGLSDAALPAAEAKNRRQ